MEDAKLAQDFLDSQVWELALWDTSLSGLLVPAPSPWAPVLGSQLELKRHMGTLGPGGGKRLMGSVCVR